MGRKEIPQEQLGFFQGPIHDAPNLILFSTSVKKELAHPTFIPIKEGEIKFPTHIIPKNTIIVGPSSRGPAREKILGEAFVIKLKKEKLEGLQAFRLTKNLVVWKVGKDSTWTLTEGKVIGCYEKQAKIISKTKLKEFAASMPK